MSSHLVPVPAVGSEGSDWTWMGSERSQYVTASLTEITMTRMVTRRLMGARAKIHKRFDSSKN